MLNDVVIVLWQALEKKYEDKTGFPSPERIETRKRRKEAAGFGKSWTYGGIYEHIWFLVNPKEYNDKIFFVW